MKLLVVKWGAYTQPDIDETFQMNHITCKQVSYCFNDKTHDDFFTRRFTKYLSADTYDAVFSVNYFPLIAQACYVNNIKYLSWSYDNPLNVLDIEDTLGYETNYVFLFDRIQVEGFRAKGYTNVYHLPLGINPYRLQKLQLSSSDLKRYASEVSFVGKLYYSTFNELLPPLDEYHQGYLKAIAEAQSKIYGYYFIDELLTDELMDTLNKIYCSSLATDSFHINREQLSYSIATNITHKERLTILSLLSRRHQLKLYSTDTHPILKDVIFCGTANYNGEMNKIFRASKINLNINLKISQSGMPLRVLDILGSGGFLLSSYQPEVAEYFIADSEVVLYSDIQEAIDKTAFYLAHEDLRSQIAINGCQKTHEEFNYTKLFTELFKTAEVL